MTVRIQVELPESQFRFLNHITRSRGDHPVGSLVADLVARELAASPAYIASVQRRGEQ